MVAARNSALAIILVVALAGALGGNATAWAAGPYFTALAESGETEMHVARIHAVAASLPDGQVLIAGGHGSGAGPDRLKSAELFNPATDAFTLLSESGETEMHVAREEAVAATLPSGEVIIAGGNDSDALLSAELFNPATDAFTLLPESGETEMHVARYGAVAAPLPDGDVLIASGYGGGEGRAESAELFSPATGTFTLLPESGDTKMHDDRFDAVAAPLPDGEVLVAGGVGNGSGFTETAELFSPAVDAFTALDEDYSAGTEMREVRVNGAVAAPLLSGRVLIGGGWVDFPFQTETTAELFSPTTDTFALPPESGEAEMQTLRYGAIAAPLQSGKVLIAGGWNEQDGGLQSAELFFAAPEALVAGGSFGDETVGDSAGEQVVVVTSASPQSLVISGASLGGSDVGDFSIVADGCAHRTLELWQSCTITARFTPTTTGAREATITLFDNEPSPAGIPLSGTGVAANSGPSGPTGPAGPAGSTGATGANGSQGPAGANGALGSQGPAGVAGPAGPAGKNGEVEFVTCKLVTAGAGKNRKTVQRCTIELTSSPVTITSAGVPVAAMLSRGKIIYATGSAAATGKKTRLLLTPRRTIDRGTYTLTLTRGRKQQRETITIT